MFSSFPKNTLGCWKKRAMNLEWAKLNQFYQENRSKADFFIPIDALDFPLSFPGSPGENLWYMGQMFIWTQEQAFFWDSFANLLLEVTVCHLNSIWWVRSERSSSLIFFFWLPQKLRQSFNHIKKSRQLKLNFLEDFAFKTYSRFLTEHSSVYRNWSQTWLQKNVAPTNRVILQQLKFTLSGQQKCWWGSQETREQDTALGMRFYFFLIKAPANTGPALPTGKGFLYYEAASAWSCQMRRVRKSRRQSVTRALSPRFPHHRAMNAFFHFHLLYLCAAQAAPRALQRCHANDTFLLLPSEGQFKWNCLLPVH